MRPEEEHRLLSLHVTKKKRRAQCLSAREEKEQPASQLRVYSADPLSLLPLSPQQLLLSLLLEEKKKEKKERNPPFKSK